MRRWLRRRKALKREMIVARGLLDLHYLAVTAHGRHQMQWVCENMTEEVDPIILGMYTFFLQHSPVADYAELN